MTARIHTKPTVAHRVMFGAQADTITEVMPLHQPKSAPITPANNSYGPQIVPEAPMIEWADPADFVAPNEWGSGQTMRMLGTVAAALVVFFALVALLPVRI